MNNLNPNQMQPRGVNVDISNTTPLTCESCQHMIFTTNYIFRKVSRLITGELKDQVVTIPVFVCSKCNTINKELLPEEVKNLL